MRKKLSEMTPFERVLPRLKGLSNDESEDVAVKNLGQVVAKHIFVNGEGADYFDALVKKICDATDQYKEEHSLELSIARADIRQEESKCKVVDMYHVK